MKDDCHCKRSEAIFQITQKVIYVDEGDLTI